MYVRYAIPEDEEYRDMTLEWVRANAYSKGTPHKTALRFRCLVNENLLFVAIPHHPQVSQQISTRTASHAHGFHPSPTHKGVYLDGHEQADVVQYCKLYLRNLKFWR